MIWKNIKYLWKYDLRELLKGVVDNTVKELEPRIKALEDTIDELCDPDIEGVLGTGLPVDEIIKGWEDESERDQGIGKYVPWEKAVEQLHEAQAESYRQDILKLDPIELFKQDRVPILTSKAIALMREWGFENVEALTRYPAAVLLNSKGVGKQTVGYIQRILAHHGLQLKGDL